MKRILQTIVPVRTMVHLFKVESDSDVACELRFMATRSSDQPNNVIISMTRSELDDFRATLTEAIAEMGWSVPEPPQ